MSGQPEHAWAVPKILPIWVITWEVWRDGQPYRKGSMRIPAETREVAQQSVEAVMRNLMPNLFRNAEVRLTSELACEAQ
jgi:hypothetical protein